MKPKNHARPSFDQNLNDIEILLNEILRFSALVIWNNKTSWNNYIIPFQPPMCFLAKINELIETSDIRKSDQVLENKF